MKGIKHIKVEIQVTYGRTGSNHRGYLLFKALEVIWQIPLDMRATAVSTEKKRNSHLSKNKSEAN